MKSLGSDQAMVWKYGFPENTDISWINGFGDGSIKDGWMEGKALMVEREWNGTGAEWHKCEEEARRREEEEKRIGEKKEEGESH